MLNIDNRTNLKIDLDLLNEIVKYLKIEQVIELIVCSNDYVEKDK